MITGKKYELTEETITLFKNYMVHRIKALRDFDSIKAGDLGGYIEKESNLSHNGDAWLYEDAMVYGDARIQSRDDSCTFGYFGPSNFYTTAFKIEGGGIGVCGYFEGTLDEFRNKVKETHGINDYVVEEYLIIADLIEHKLSGRLKK